MLLDEVFGRDCFVNEIIWAYDYGARSTKRWSPKHDTILWYAANRDWWEPLRDRAPVVESGWE